MAPDAFDVIDVSANRGLTNDQRRNLGSIAKILQFAASNKGVRFFKCVYIYSIHTVFIYVFCYLDKNNVNILTFCSNFVAWNSHLFYSSAATAFTYLASIRTLWMHTTNSSTNSLTLLQCDSSSDVIGPTFVPFVTWRSPNNTSTSTNILT